MYRHSSTVLFVILFFGAVFISGLRADDNAQSTIESRLRDALRDNMQQLRDAQGQVATLQATQTQSDKDNADLKTKVDALNAEVAALTKQNADDKAASAQANADLKGQNDQLTAQIGRLNEALAAWEKDDKANIQLARDKEAARQQLAIQVALQQRVIDDRETKNLALYQLGNDILVRYEQYGLGEAITAKEPFTGLTRVKLQELVQDYKDKIEDQRVTPGEVPSSRPAGGPSEPKSAPVFSAPASSVTTTR